MVKFWQALGTGVVSNAFLQQNSEQIKHIFKCTSIV